MCSDKAEQHERQRDHVKRKKAIESDIADTEVTANPYRQIFADDGDGSEEVNDYLRAPV